MQGQTFSRIICNFMTRIVAILILLKCETLFLNMLEDKSDKNGTPVDSYEKCVFGTSYG